MVWDNASDKATIDILNDLYARSYIDKLCCSPENLFFAGGNNACVKMASDDVKYYLLLNSDVKIVSPRWFSHLFAAKRRGKYAVASYGCCVGLPKRVDGYCYLIDRAVYDRIPLDDRFQWWWSITKQQAAILNEGLDIMGFYNHEKMLVHWGGKSNVNLQEVSGNDVEFSEIIRWFDNSKGKVRFVLSPGINRIAYFGKRILNKLAVFVRK